MYTLLINLTYLRVRFSLSNVRLRRKVIDEGGFFLVHILLARSHLARPTADLVVDFPSFVQTQHASPQNWLRLPQNSACRHDPGETLLRVLRQIWIYSFFARTGIKPQVEEVYDESLINVPENNGFNGALSSKVANLVDDLSAGI